MNALAQSLRLPPPSSEIAAYRKQRATSDTEAETREAELIRCGKDADGIVHWFNKYVWTYDPRLLGEKDENGNPISPYVPFILWPRQVEAIHFLWERLEAKEEWLWEKSRDTGASYVACGFALNRWLFCEGFKATFGSRKVDFVDKAGQPDSLFEKMRIMLQRLPIWMMPKGFTMNQHSHFLRLINPERGGIITGEGGEEMGRGGRSTMYVVDEAAFVPNAENVEKALSGNTDCIGWVSTVNGMGNLFYRKRHGVLKAHQVFRMHWRDDPRKTDEWAAKKEASLSDPTAWASEYEIDYAASTEGVCIPAKWVQAAQRVADLDPRVKESNLDFTLGGDVGAGKARSVIVARRGPIVLPPRARSEPDTIGTAHWMLDAGIELQARMLNFDSPGVGVGVTSALLHSEDRPVSLTVQPVNTGDAPSDLQWDDGKTSEEQFLNLKAEIWWLARMALKRTYEHVLWLEGADAEKGPREHRPSEVISLPIGDTHSDRLAAELSVVKYFHNDKGKIKIESKDQLARRGVKSPDYADAFVLTFVPDRGSGYTLDNL